MKYLLWCLVLWSESLNFWAIDSFPDNFTVYCFMMFIQFLMKELTGIHIRKISISWVSFKMLFSMCLGWEGISNIAVQNGPFKKLQWCMSFSSKCSFLPLILKKNKNKHAEYYEIFIPGLLKIWESHFLMFGSWRLIWYLRVWVKRNFYFKL